MNARAIQIAEPEDDLWIMLIQELGREVVMRLCKALGGVQIKIPANVRPGHLLEQAIGMEYAERLTQIAAGEKLYIRHPPGHMDERYLDAVKSGLNNHDIARRFGVSERAVRIRFQKLGIRNPNRRPNRRSRPVLALPDLRTAPHAIAAE